MTLTLQDIILMVYALGQIAGTVALAWRVSRVEEVLGNGKPGKFVTRTEVALMKEASEADRKEIRAWVGKLEERIGGQ